MTIVWLLIHVPVCIFCVYITYRFLRPDIKKEFPKDKYLYLANKSEKDKYSSIEKDFPKRLKFFLKKDTLVIFGFVLLMCMVPLDIILKGIDYVSNLLGTYPDMSYYIQFNWFSACFFILVTITTTWVIIESRFDDIYEDIYETQVKAAYKQFNLYRSKKEWEDDV